MAPSALLALGPTPAGGRTSLGELIGLRAAARPDHPYLVHARRGRPETFGSLEEAAGEWGRWLSTSGTGGTEPLGLAIADPLDFSVAFLSLLAQGRAVAPLDPGAPDAALLAACRRVGTRLVLSDRPSPPEAPVTWLGLRERGLPPAGRHCATGPVPARRPVADRTDPANRVAERSAAVVLASSGSTGEPKVVRLEEAQLLHTARAVAGHLGLSERDRGFSPLPLFHVNAEVVGLLASLLGGASLILDDRFHRRGFWTLLEEERVTWVNAVPAVIARLTPLGPGERVPTELRFVRSASAPLPVATMERFEAATGVPVVETYGMTEAASQIAANPLEGRRKPGSVGRPVGVELRIVPLGDGQPVGRVQIRGAGVITAYADGRHGERFDPEGWLDTGDLGHLDDEGYLYLDGRADDVINRGGEKIYPRTVEEVILGDPDVLAAAVTGRPDPELGQLPVGYLVVRDLAGAGRDQRAREVAERVRRRCEEHLGRSARPVELHVVEALPAVGPGKVRRAELADQRALATVGS